MSLVPADQKRAPGRPPKFDEEKRSQYVALLAAGIGRHEAARQLDVSPRTVAFWRAGVDEFREACEEAESVASEPVERALYEAAKRGEPWAVKMWLTNRTKGRWHDEQKVAVEVSGEVKVEPGQQMAQILELSDRLRARRLELEAGDVIEGEVVEG